MIKGVEEISDNSVCGFMSPITSCSAPHPEKKDSADSVDKDSW